MKTKDILFLVLVLAMIQDKALGAPKHFLIETKDTGAGFGRIAKYSTAWVRCAIGTVFTTF